MKDCNLIFCGVDRVGKTQLIDLFAGRHLSFLRKKMRVPATLEESIEYYSEYFDDLWNETRPTIWDRGHICEQVYAPLYRKEYVCYAWPYGLNVMEGIATALPTVIVYVYPRWFGLMKQDERPNARRIDEMQLYDTTLSFSHLPIVRISKHHELHERWRESEDVYAELVQAVNAAVGE